MPQNQAIAERINEAESALRALNLPDGERNALVLLALLKVGPTTPWSAAQSPELTITEIMAFIADEYGKAYAPNTRETIRKMSVHAFRDAGLVRDNGKPRSSPKYAHAVTASALALFQTLGSARWLEMLREFLGQQTPSLATISRWLSVHPEQVRLKALRLRNFRSLQDTGVVPITPILILVGRNSSGKSSFLRLFPLLRQTARSRSASPLAWYQDGGDVDFGNFENVLGKGSQTPDEILIDFHFDLDRGGAVPALPVEAEARLCDDASRTLLRALALKVLDRRVLLRFDDEGVLSVFTVDGKDALASYAARREPGSLLPRLIDTEGEPADFARVVPLLLATLSGWLAGAAHRIHYSGPMRAAPQRQYRAEETIVSQIDPAGRNTAMFLRSLSEEQRQRFSAWVKDRFGFGVVLEPAGSINVAIRIVEGDPRGEGSQRFDLIDMGYGFSQVLPILVQSWASEKGISQGTREQSPSVLALEQPELHLHPHHQERLADVFANMVRQQEQPLSLILETHSETMVNRFGELVAEGVLSGKQLTILLFEKDPSTGITQVRRTGYDERGFLQHWPVGFFAP